LKSLCKEKYHSCNQFFHLLYSCAEEVNMQPDSIGKRLKTLREKRNLTLRALAAKAGVPQSTLSMVENGTRPGAGLRLGTVKRLCWALGVGIGELAGSIDEEMRPTDAALGAA
jgi:transcriptional regulator with XRE-family HTH domain